MKRRMHLGATVLAIGLLQLERVNAASLTWNNGAANMRWDTASANWGGATLWNNTTPDSATFTTTGAGTVNLNTPIVCGGITFTSGSYTIANNGTPANTLTLSSAPTITTTVDASISAILSGSQGFTKAGAAGLTLSGANSGLSGAVNINNGPGYGSATAGAIVVGSDNALGTGDVVLGNTGAISAMYFNDTRTINNNIQLTSSAVNTSFTGANAKTATLAGVISGGNASSIFFVNMNTSGSSGVFKLGNTSNTFRATLYFNRGVLAITGDGCLGNSANLVRLDQTSNNGGLRFDGSGINVLHAIDWVSRCDINVNGYDATISGNISGAGNDESSRNNIRGGTLSGGNSTGSLRLSGANTMLAPLSVAADTKLIAASTTALGSVSGTTRVLSGGTLSLDSVGTYANAEPLTLNGTGVQAAGSGVGALENLTGANVFNGPVTLGSASSIGVTAGSLTLGGAIGGSGMALTKIGPGTLTLSGTSTYTGATAINQGTLKLSGALGNTAVTVAAGATLDGEGSIGATGSLTFSDGASLRIDASTAGALTVGSGATGDLTLNGTTTVCLDVRPAPGDGTSTIRLLNYYGGLTGSAANLSLANGGSYRNPTFSASGGQVNLSFDSYALTWAGTNGAAWDINTTANWTSALPDQYCDGDSVAFTDAGTTKAVTLNTTVSPAAVTVNNSTGNDYSFSGTGGIAGTNGLTKSGTGSLTLGTANTYTGVTTVNGGTLSVATFANGGAASGIGSSSSTAANLVFGGGALQYTGNSATSDRNFTLNAGGGTIDVFTAGQTLTLSGAPTGANAFGKAGAGNLAFSTDNALNAVGAIAVSGGDFQTPVGTLTQTRNVSIASGATFTSTGTIGITAPSGNSTIVGGAGTWRLRSAGSSINNPDIYYSPAGVGVADAAILSSVVETGDSGNTRYIKGNSNRNDFYRYSGDLRFQGALAGAGNLHFYGTPYNSSYEMTFTLWANNSAFTGDVTLQRGDLILYDNNALSAANDVTLNPGAGENAYLHPWGTGFTINLGNLSSSGSGNARVIGHYNQSLTINETADTTFGGIILNENGTLAIAKAGAGTLTLAGANTYSGTTTVGGGVLRIATNGVVSTPAAAMSISGGTLAVDGGSVSVGGVQSALLLGAGGNVSLSSGTLTVNNSANSQNYLNSGASTWTQTGGAFVSTDSNQLRIGNGGATTMTISGGTFTKAAGQVMLGYNTAGTSLTITNSGYVEIGGEFDLAWTGSNLGDAATVNLDGGTLKVSNMIWNGNAGDYANVNFNGGTLLIGASHSLTTNAYLRTIVKTGGAVIDTFGNAYTIANALTAGTPSGGLTKLGEGTLTLTAANTYSGATAISAGTLKLVGAAMAVAGGVTVGPGILALNQTTGTIAAPQQIGSKLSGTNTINATGGGWMSLQSTASDFSGTFNITGNTKVESWSGQTALTCLVNIESGSGFAIGNHNSQVGALSGAGDVFQGWNTGTYTLTVGAGDNSGTFSGVIHGNNASSTQGNLECGVIALTKAGTGTQALSGVNTYNGATTISAGVLELTGSGQLGSGSYAAAVANTGILKVNSTASQTLSGAITGTGALVKDNSGTLILTGANTYGGGTTISGGILQIGSGGTSGQLGSGGVVTNNAVLAFNRSDGITVANVITGSGSLTKSGGGMLTLGGANDFAGGTALNAGNLKLNHISALGGGTLTIGTGASVGTTTTADLDVTALTGSQTLANDVVLPNDASAAIRGLYMKGTAGNLFTLAGAISGGSANTTLFLNNDASGSYLPQYRLSNAANSFRANININRGGLQVDSNEALGNPANTITFNSNSGAAFTFNNSLTCTHAVTLSTGTEFATGANHATFTGVISGGNYLNKTGSGTLTLGAGNTYSGNTTVSEGTLKITGGIYTNAHRTTVVTVQSGSTLELSTWYYGSSESLGMLAAGVGQVVVNGGTIRMSNSSATSYGRGVTVNSGGATLDAGGSALWTIDVVSDNNDWVYNGNPSLIFTGGGLGRFDKVLSGGGSLIKSGSGTWTVGGANTYGGSTTVSNGTLRVSATGKLGSGNVTVAGGVLALQGTSAINDAARLTLAVGASVTLDYSGEEVVGELWFGTARKWKGVWGAEGSDAPNKSNLFTGTGYVRVTAGAPHPATLIQFN